MSARSFDVNKEGKYGNVKVKHVQHLTFVILHQTEVLMFDNISKVVKLNSGGWKTNTTKTAMNNALNQLGLKVEVKQVKGEWFVMKEKEKHEFIDNQVVFL